MKTENRIKCWESLEEEINKLCKLNCEIMDMQKAKPRVSKAEIVKKQGEYDKLLIHFRGMYDMAILTGEFTYPDGRSSIQSTFGWILQ